MDLETIEKCVEQLHDIFEDTSLDSEWVKMQKKAQEARYNSGDVTPLADCILSLLLAARSQGHSPAAVFDALVRVSKRNLDRRWKKMPDGTYQSV